METTGEQDTAHYTSCQGRLSVPRKNKSKNKQKNIAE